MILALTTPECKARSQGLSPLRSGRNNLRRGRGEPTERACTPGTVGAEGAEGPGGPGCGARNTLGHTRQPGPQDRRRAYETSDASAGGDHQKLETPDTTAHPQHGPTETEDTSAPEKCTTNAHFSPAQAMAVSIPHRYQQAKATMVSDYRAPDQQGLAAAPVGGAWLRYPWAATTPPPAKSRT